jgi:hypothetical protein
MTPWQKIQRWIGLFLVAFGLGVVLLAGGFAVKGSWDWNRVRSDLESRGENLSLPGLAPEPIPAADNFFADPLWEETAINPDGPVRLAGIFPPLTEDEVTQLKEKFPALAGDLVPGPRHSVAQKIFLAAKDRALTKDEAAFLLEITAPGSTLEARLAELAQRRGARYPLNYEEGPSTKMPAVEHLMRIARFLSIRARAHLALGESEKALEETLLIFRLARTLETEPFLISLLVGMSIDAMALDLVSAGLASWPESGVRRVEEALQKIHLTRDLARVLRGERALAGVVMEKIRRSPETLVAGALAWQEPSKKPSFGHVALGMLYNALFLSGDQAFHYAAMQSWIDAVEADPELLGPKVLDGPNAEINHALDLPLGRLRHVMSALALAGLQGTFQRVAYVQSRVQQARIACALRRYVLARGQLPATLAALVPDFLEKVPADIIDGRPMSYRTEKEGSYTLWSIGWDSIDGGGEDSAAKRDKTKAPDWVWKN